MTCEICGTANDMHDARFHAMADQTNVLSELITKLETAQIDVRFRALAERLDAGSACCTSRYRELAHENMAMSERLAKVEAAQHAVTNRFRPTFEQLVSKVGPLQSTALASAERDDRCDNGTCVDRAGHQGPCTPRREAKVTSAEGRPACQEWCGSKDEPSIPHGQRAFHGIPGSWFCSEGCRDGRRPLNPAVMMDAEEPEKATCGTPIDGGRAVCGIRGALCNACWRGRTPVISVAEQLASETAKAPLMNQVCPCDCCQGKINASRCLRRTDFVRDLEAKLAEAKRDNDRWGQYHETVEAQLAEAEKERDIAMASRDAWKAKADWAGPARDKAVLAERARCWNAVDARVANIEMRRQLDEAINGVPAPKGSAT